MRYTLESTLPINAFSPRGKGPFSRGMTLEGGGGGGVVGAITNPISKALGTSGGGGGLLGGLASIDKAVGNVIPGGWGTLASVAGAAMGVPTPALVGLGALTGSGVMHKGGNFNLQGALMGGAMAYGMSQLGQYARASDLSAGLPTEISAPSVTAPAPQTDFIGSFAGPNAPVGGDMISGFSGANPAIGTGYTPPPPGIASNIMSGNFGDAASQIGSKISNAASSGLESLQNFGEKAVNPSTYTEGLKTGFENMGKTGSGIYDLIADNSAATAQADKIAAATGIAAPGKAAMLTGVGLMGAAASDAQREYQSQADAANAQANAQYNAQLAAIAEDQDRASEAMRKNPYRFAEGGDVQGYADGGLLERIIQSNPNGILAKMLEMKANQQSAPSPSVPSPGGFLNNIRQSLPMSDDQRAYAAMRANPYQFSSGGSMPRFLSGGGDGLSDDIPATIEGKQPARLADGEFVVSSDVVSGLGGGSSKAGAKKLYDMMDRVRKQAHGTKKQIRPVSNKALPA